MNKSNKNLKPCSRCKGLGRVVMLLKAPPWRHYGNGGNCGESHIVVCPMPGCHNGIMDVEENYRITFND